MASGWSSVAQNSQSINDLNTPGKECQHEGDPVIVGDSTDHCKSIRQTGVLDCENVETLQYLLERPVDPNHSRKHGFSVLHRGIVG
jgi:hypothetical protein